MTDDFLPIRETDFERIFTVSVENFPRSRDRVNWHVGKIGERIRNSEGKLSMSGSSPIPDKFTPLPLIFAGRVAFSKAEIPFTPTLKF